MGQEKKYNPDVIYTYVRLLQSKNELTDLKNEKFFDMLVKASKQNNDLTYLYKYIEKIPNISFDKLLEAASILNDEKLIKDLIPVAEGNVKTKLIFALLKLGNKNDNIDIDTLYDYILSTNDEVIRKELINYLIDYSLEVKEGKYLYSLANKNLISLSLLEDIAVEMNNPKLLYDIIVFIKESDKEKLINALADTKNTMYIYFVSEFMNNPPIKLLEDAIINCDDAKYIYYFALDNQDTNRERLVDRIIELKDITYMEQCMTLPISIEKKLLISRTIEEELYSQKGKNRVKSK